MNLIKSLFITLGPVWLVITLIQGVQLMLESSWLMATGMMLSAAPLALFLIYILTFKQLARTSKHLYTIQLSSLVGFVICLYLTVQHQDHHFVLFLAAGSYVITLCYIYWYSQNNRVKSPHLKIGHKLPDFSIQDSNGHTITAAELRTQPTVLMFTRGNWCPLCMAQINEVVAAYQQLDDLGVQVAVVASQPEKNTQSLAARFAVPILFLIDKNQQLGRQLGLIHSNGLPFGFQTFGHQSDQYYPTVIATDDRGIIIYSDQTDNYRLRPEPEDWLQLYS